MPTWFSSLRNQYFSKALRTMRTHNAFRNEHSSRMVHMKQYCNYTAVSQSPVRWAVEVAEDGTRLDRFIKRHAPGLPPGLIQRLIRKRRVLVGDVPAIRNAHPVRTGDVVELPGEIKLGLDRGKKKPKADDVSLAEAAEVRSWILHRDARCVVLNKPAGLPVQGGTGVGRHVEGLLCGLGSGRYRLVHRLDKEVSGAMVVARDVGAAGLLAEHFRSRCVRKVYWGLVVGRPRNSAGVIELEIEGKRARTKYRTIVELDAHYCWLEFEPTTGRKHQLRIHCAEGLGTPLMGDDKYGGVDIGTGGGGILAGAGLHLMSREIEFPKLTMLHGSGRKGSKGFIRVQAPLPAHMKDTWKRFGLDERLA